LSEPQQNYATVHPFDRVLIAAAAVEDLELVTLDAEIRLFASPRLGVIFG
jgi:PIN domain nuclease of toxin-antitoxin system